MHLISQDRYTRHEVAVSRAGSSSGRRTQIASNAPAAKSNPR